MKQHNQIGKKYKKDDVLDSKKGRTFVTPKGKSWEFDYHKEGRRYFFVIIYNGRRYRMFEQDFNRYSIDDLIDSIERSTNIN